jgi:hypothetical protein
MAFFVFYKIYLVKYCPNLYPITAAVDITVVFADITAALYKLGCFNSNKFI